MAALRPRAYVLIVQDREISDLSIDFQITRSLTSKQNAATITVINASAETRRHLQQVKGGVIVRLEAGYLGGDPTKPSVAPSTDKTPHALPLIFLGKLREVTSLRSGAEWNLKITSGDGDGKNARISFSVGPGAEISKIIEQTVKAIGVGVGNAKQAIAGAAWDSGGGLKFPSGAVIHGRADHELDRLMQSVGKSYSIQNGDLQVTDLGKPVNLPAHVCDVSNGLVGSPEMGRDDKGVVQVKFKSLLTAEIFPGRQVLVRSEQVDAHFRVTKSVYAGQSYGNDWFVESEATPV